jgi:hypothetical protein
MTLREKFLAQSQSEQCAGQLAKLALLYLKSLADETIAFECGGPFVVCKTTTHSAYSDSSIPDRDSAAEALG